MISLVLQHISITLGQSTVVRDLSLTAGGGNLLGLIGPNGAGKTSLLKAIAGVLPFEGQIALDGVDCASIGRKHLAQQVAYLAQEKVAHWPLPVREVAMLGRLPHLAPFQHPGASDEAAVSQALEQTDMTALAERNILALSGGEQARAFLARALAVEAPVLLADEPIAALDPSHQLGIMDQLRRYAESGALVIVVMHDLTLAARFCHELVLLSEGNLVAHGQAPDVLTDDNLRQVYGISVARSEAQGGHIVVPWDRLAD